MSIEEKLREIHSQAHNLPRTGTADRIATLAEEALREYVNGEEWKNLAHEAFLQLEYVHNRSHPDRRHSSTVAVLLRLSEKLGVPLEKSSD